MTDWRTRRADVSVSIPFAIVLTLAVGAVALAVTGFALDDERHAQELRWGSVILVMLALGTYLNASQAKYYAALNFRMEALEQRLGFERPYGVRAHVEDEPDDGGEGAPFRLVR